MFRTKSRTEQLSEQLQDQSDSLAATATSIADQLRERVVPAVGQATENAREWARPRVEHGIEVAAPRLESAVNGLAPKVDTARDKIVDELIPRIAEAISAWAAASAAAKDEAISRGQGAAAVLTGDAVASPRGRKKRVLLGLGLLTGAAAATMAFMKRPPKDDPWTTPLADAYGSTPNGRHSAGSTFDEAAVTIKTDPDKVKSQTIDPLDEKDSHPLDLAKDADLSAADAGGNGEANNGRTDGSDADNDGADKDPQT